MNLISKNTRVLFLLLVLLAIVVKIHAPRVYGESQRERIIRIYAQIVAATGEANSVPILSVLDVDIVNAWTDGTTITVTTGIAVYSENDDELALIIGHEMAHALLKHVPFEARPEWYEIGIKEAQADKMGAYYMMRAGYDVCIAREFWKRLAKHGDYLYADHPNYSYRYDQLNVGCGG